MIHINLLSETERGRWVIVDASVMRSRSRSGSPSVLGPSVFHRLKFSRWAVNPAERGAPRAFLCLAFTILPLGHFFGRCRKYRELGGKRECFSVGNNELNDLEGFVMSPGQDIPVATENVNIILVVSASKIKRRFARGIGHQKNG